MPVLDLTTFRRLQTLGLLVRFRMTETEPSMEIEGIIDGLLYGSEQSLDPETDSLLCESTSEHLALLSFSSQIGKLYFCWGGCQVQ